LELHDWGLIDAVYDHATRYVRRGIGRLVRASLIVDTSEGSEALRLTRAREEPLCSVIITEDIVADRDAPRLMLDRRLSLPLEVIDERFILRPQQ
jgi:hypothetical protein